jgi:hypothetical protein
LAFPCTHTPGQNQPVADDCFGAAEWGSFLKVLANAGSYGLFVEVNPKAMREQTAVEVFSENKHFENDFLFIEEHGDWYFPPVASLITACGRLLLAMLEKVVVDRNGTYLFCDTDSMCIVATEAGGEVDCDGPEGNHQIHALSRGEVESISRRFRLLNHNILFGNTWGVSSPLSIAIRTTVTGHISISRDGTAKQPKSIFCR